MVAAALFLVLALPRDADRVLVIRNDDSPASVEIADDYMLRRKVPNVLDVHCRDSALGADKETISYADFQEAVEKPLRAYLAKHSKIDFIVTTKGVPIRITDAPSLGMAGKQPSLDSFIAALGYDNQPGALRVDLNDSGFTGKAFLNRYWDAHEPFSHEKFGGYLVTRLDAYTVDQAKALTTYSLQAEKTPPAGEILLDTCPAFGYGDPAAQPVSAVTKSADPAAAAKSINELAYKEYNADMLCAAAKLQAKGLPVELDKTDKFVGGKGDLMGYCSWGSNDAHFDAKAYSLLRFAPGGICETAVSTSGRTFLPTTGGQSLIADLIAGRVTGAKGYCDEPLLQAIASPTILFDRYTSGWTLAESYYAASRFVGWEDIVVGDPLCRPYSRRK
jgi:uncharacterized protein (TIGR03790 family)